MYHPGRAASSRVPLQRNFLYRAAYTLGNAAVLSILYGADTSIMYLQSDRKPLPGEATRIVDKGTETFGEIGRASCRERV